MQYSKFVKPAFEDFILPTKKYADIIIPRGGDNHVAVDLIVQHIHTKLGQHNLCKIYSNLYVIQSTFQVLAAYRPLTRSFNILFSWSMCIFKQKLKFWHCHYLAYFFSRYVACIHLYVMPIQLNMISYFIRIG